MSHLTATGDRQLTCTALWSLSLSVHTDLRPCSRRSPDRAAFCATIRSLKTKPIAFSRVSLGHPNQASLFPADEKRDVTASFNSEPPSTALKEVTPHTRGNLSGGSGCVWFPVPLIPPWHLWDDSLRSPSSIWVTLASFFRAVYRLDRCLLCSLSQQPRWRPFGKASSYPEALPRRTIQHRRQDLPLREKSTTHLHTRTV